MHVKNDFFKRGYFKIGDGTSVRFWEELASFPTIPGPLQHCAT
jgi:hypothetical protein